MKIKVIEKQEQHDIWGVFIQANPDKKYELQRGR